MDLQKLKIEKFNRIHQVNFDKYKIDIDTVDENYEVIIYYIDSEEDLESAIKMAVSSNLPTENRLILVYEKGRKDGVNRNLIINPFKNENMYGFKTTEIFKLKAPNLCSLNEKLSAAFFMYVG